MRLRCGVIDGHREYKAKNAVRSDQLNTSSTTNQAGAVGLVHRHVDARICVFCFCPGWSRQTQIQGYTDTRVKIGFLVSRIQTAKRFSVVLVCLDEVQATELEARPRFHVVQSMAPAGVVHRLPST